MLLTILLLVPLLASGICLIAPGRPWLEAVTVTSAAAVLALAGFATQQVTLAGHISELANWLYADALSIITLLVIAIVSFTTAIYSVGYLREDMREQDVTQGEGLRHLKRYYVLFNLFVFSMLIVPLSNSLGVLWIAIEGTTLASLFLVSFYGTGEALEAAWKYVIIGSVGIALALFGTILAYYSAVQILGTSYDLNWSVLAPVAAHLNPSIMRLSFLFIVVGYGTKAGLAPMHTWLPDAHSEAPSPISALLSGVLLNCAMYGILRFYALAVPSLGHAYPAALLLTFGFISLAVAVLLIFRQRDYKRLLAYSSVEHMGIVALGVAFGGTLGLFGALFQVLNHAVTKSLMFFASGQVLLKYQTKDISRVSGVIKIMPATGTLLLVGGLALTGAPPFSIFISEFAILSAGFRQGYAVAAIALLVLIALIFIGVLFYLNSMVFGKASAAIEPGEVSYLSILAMVLSALLVLVLGVYIPTPLSNLLHQAAAVLGGTSR
ncbi:MAG TPA: hydrogenase 4 subunit F [Ktedonobacteraceae bacterium]|nr:hydrogenase 4 subunit F [Ktedonobacteraceae bacterium]